MLRNIRKLRMSDFRQSSLMQRLPAGLNIIWEFYGNMYDGINAGAQVGTTQGQSANYAGYQFDEGDVPANLIYLGNGGQFAKSTSHNDVNINKVYGMQLTSDAVNDSYWPASAIAFDGLVIEVVHGAAWTVPIAPTGICPLGG